jgi:hypothetical protein
MRNCNLCGKEFEPSRGQRESLRKNPGHKTYCSSECTKQGRVISKTIHSSVSHTCPVCSVEFILNNAQAWKLRNGKKSIFCCSRSCASKEIYARPEFQQAFNSKEAQEKRDAALAEKLLPLVAVSCEFCKNEFQLSMSQRSELRAGRQNRFFCSTSCSGKWVLNQPGQQEIRQSKVSQLRLERDFLNTPEAISKRVETLKLIGVTGGSGRPPPKPHQMLADALSLPIEYPINSGRNRSDGFKAVYHVDIASPDVKLAIEVDGRSHRYGLWPERDRKKTEVLNSLGWVVLRFTNKEIMDNLDAYAQKVIAMIQELMQKP